MNLPYFILASNKDFQDTFEFLNCENPGPGLLSTLKITDIPQIVLLDNNPEKEGEANVMRVSGGLSYANLWRLTYIVIIRFKFGYSKQLTSSIY